MAGDRGSTYLSGCAAAGKKCEKESFHMANTEFGKDKIKRVIPLPEGK